MLRQLYEGKARIASVPGGGQGESGEELVFTSTGRVSVPVCVTDVQVDDLVEVVSHRDPMVVGRTWRVVGVGVGGSLQAVRSLTVSVVKRHSNWTWVLDAAPSSFSDEFSDQFDGVISGSA